MGNKVSTATRRRIMQAIRSKNTTPELAVRRFLHRHGYRFRVHVVKLPGTPDLVLPKHRTVVFVHGCFWHQHRCRLGKKPKTNLAYWSPKMARIRVRDRQQLVRLKQLGWQVIVVWECESTQPAKLKQKLLGKIRKRK